MKLNIKKIKSKMKRMSWTYQYLADQMGVSKQYIHIKFKYPESCTFRSVEKFARALNLEEKDLIN